MTHTDTSDRFGEIISTSSSAMIAQCYELYKTPQIGAIVRIGDGASTAYCVIKEIRTESVDPGRRPTAMGKEMESLAQLHSENPQIEQLFKTDVDLIVIGSDKGEGIQTTLPVQPPPIHSFVYTCTSDEIQTVTTGPDFLQILLQTSQNSNINLIAACIKYCAPCHLNTSQYLTFVGKQLVQALYSEPNRLNMILRAINAV